jgi:hypothetical protein
MDPKIKQLAKTALYGVAGGALLGTASLAFGTEPRSIAKGASLGLYAGLLFGGYIVVTHAMKKNRMNQPPPSVPYGGSPTENMVPIYEPYPEDANEYDSTYDETMDSSIYQKWDPYQMSNKFLERSDHFKTNRLLKNRPLFYFNLIQYNF